MVLQYFAAKVNKKLTSNGDFHTLDGEYYRAKFQNAFKLPFAGRRKLSDASLEHQGSYGFYWSSSPLSPLSVSSASVRTLSLDSYQVNAGSISYRAIGISVRCFKNSDIAPRTYDLEFDANGGTLPGADSQ